MIERFQEKQDLRLKFKVFKGLLHHGKERMYKASQSQRSQRKVHRSQVLTRTKQIQISKRQDVYQEETSSSLSETSENQDDIKSITQDMWSPNRQALGQNNRGIAERVRFNDQDTTIRVLKRVAQPQE